MLADSISNGVSFLRQSVEDFKNYDEIYSKVLIERLELAINELDKIRTEIDDSGVEDEIDHD